MKKYLLITPVFLLLAGAGCQTSNSTDVNTNTAVMENTNVAVVENTNVETNSNVDTSDWKTYTNDEYGFSFKYPSDWEVGANKLNSVSVKVEALSNLPENENIAPTSNSSPTTYNQNITEKSNLESGIVSAFGGVLLKTANTNFFRYMGYIEGGSIDIEYVTYAEDNKVTIRYLEGDNADFVAALNMYSREELIEQYKNNSIDNKVLKQNFETLKNIVETYTR